MSQNAPRPGSTPTSAPIRPANDAANLAMGLANDAANLAMGPGNDAARLRTASVSQDPRKCLRTASIRQDQRKYCVLVTLPNHLFCNASLLQAVSRTLPRTHPVGAVVMSVLCLS